ncbi:hypothetical protein [Syntrophobacter fumaroxidans]|uniref:Curli production assembly/transport component CsgG n=1 Tax=Syntrophobacter fumaroxidans (strain DSM 10017 / MPOB) TaxID=335543 RepID=A0LFC0_SYNFM|nr:hypothetical protein [Syntrophobacter fumaroxidans]ABK16122.1 hypothetical protein Sfum_0422 [Syntrophobacter fumaroxidans MPOB]
MTHAARKCVVTGLALAALLLTSAFGLDPRDGWSQTVFFSQGQAPYDPQNRQKSQQNAVREFQVQAITQAVGTFLSTSQMGTKFQAIKDKVLRQPERYVDAYQVFSETVENGRYQVAGQVTVAMGLLKKDLIAFDIYASDDAGEDGKRDEDAVPPRAGPGEPAPVRPGARVTDDSNGGAKAPPGGPAGDADEDGEGVTDQESDEESVGEQGGIPAGARKEPSARIRPGAPSDDAEANGDTVTDEPGDEQEAEDQGGPPAGAREEPSARIRPGAPAGEAEDDGDAASDTAGGEPAREGQGGAPAGAQGKARPEAREAAPVPAGGPRGITSTSNEIFWAVSEKWDQTWYLPGDLKDPRGLFAASVVQELLDYRYTLHFPEPGALKVDNMGNASSSQAVSQARMLGIRNVVVGRVVLHQRSKEPARLDAELQIIEAASGKSLGKLRKTRNLEELTNQEGAMELAGDVTNELTGLLSGDTRAAAPAGPVPVAGEGEWVLRLQAADHHAYWREVEKLLREQARGMTMLGMEMGPQETVIRLGGIDGRTLSSLDGRVLSGGVTIKIDDLSPDTRTTRVLFVRQAVPQPGPKP